MKSYSDYDSGRVAGQDFMARLVYKMIVKNKCNTLDIRDFITRYFLAHGVEERNILEEQEFSKYVV